jgi:hypothetical protein
MRTEKCTRRKRFDLASRSARVASFGASAHKERQVARAAGTAVVDLSRGDEIPLMRTSCKSEIRDQKQMLTGCGNA